MAVSTSPFPYHSNITDGPGYRAWQLFRELTKKHEITVLSLYESFHLKNKKEYEVIENNIRVKCVSHQPSRIAKLIEHENPDVLYLPWSSSPFLSRLKSKIPTIVDYVGSGLLEEYATKGFIPTTLLQMKLKSFWLGDFFITAGQRERYYLLGLLIASKKLSYSKHLQTDKLIHVIPMTPSPEPPILDDEVIQKRPNDLVLLVAGAFLPWYDYKTLFEAIRLLNKQELKNIKLVFMGGSPKNPKFERFVREMANNCEIQDNILFTGLVPFKKRANYYLLSDIAINIPSITMEDELSVRTRVIDYIWANLPIISPAKDEYSSMVVNAGAGFRYEAGNPLSLSKTISMIMNNPTKLEQAKNKLLSLQKDRFNLKNYISPLESFIENPNVDPTRLSTKGVSSDLFLWIRDIFSMLKS